MYVKYIRRIGYILAVCIVFVTCATMWAMSQSAQRTECYRHAKAVEDCSQPGWFERLIRGANQ
jgi:hypothetical protein